MNEGYLKILLTNLLLLGLASGSVIAQQSTKVQSLILEGSKLRINGTSNVNDFECIYEDPIRTDTLTYSVEFEETSVKLEGDDLTLKIESFDCGKRGINRDFRKTLKSDVYPNIDIELLSVVSQSNIPALANVATTLGGITKEYTVELKDYTFENGIATVSGTNTINMSDFNISPPTALFGLIKVKNQIEINFNLIIEQ
ncbi:MAG: YceI family protein [Balneolaceae bacterium]